ncbi:hypothetical protein CRM22_010135 [Opisthorchis felineus]|uniref:Uncharacterized protein n=1 Tax=Opisthorchis felineus TaxID=147828 RepID=A0A4S2L7H4_OPIFE|nr:hypothetical protein CRM22_010135 [Opisthorchis felineus]
MKHRIPSTNCKQRDRANLNNKEEESNVRNSFVPVSCVSTVIPHANHVNIDRHGYRAFHPFANVDIGCFRNGTA